MTSSQQTTPTPSDLPTGTAVDRFLAAIRDGAFASADDVYDPAVRLDATVPGWRFAVVDDGPVRDEYGRWFASPNQFVELQRRPTADGEVVEYFITWTENGEVHGAHHAHLLTVDRATDRITDDHVFCGGRWPASLLTEMGAPSFSTAV